MAGERGRRRLKRRLYGKRTQKPDNRPQSRKSVEAFSKALDTLVPKKPKGGSS